MSKKWINGLDSIRFFLALWVLLSHIPFSKYIKPFTSNIWFGKFLEDVLNSSFVGVAAVIGFFVLSGIVIHFPYRKNNSFNTYEFLFRRYLRIGIPIMIISLFANFFESFYLLPLWSLYCELIYYTLYPLILTLKQRYKLKYIFVVTFLLAFIVLFVASNSIRSIFTHEAFNGNYHELGIKYTWLLGLPCWLLGVKIADDYDVLIEQDTSFKTIVFWRIIVVFISCICFVMRYKFWVGFSISLNFFSLIAYIWLRKEISFWNKRDPIVFFENAGKWSYSLYICHALTPYILSFVFNWKNHFTVFDFVLILSFSFLFSYFFYLLVEKPSINLTTILAKRIFRKKQDL